MSMSSAIGYPKPLIALDSSGGHKHDGAAARRAARLPGGTPRAASPDTPAHSRRPLVRSNGVSAGHDSGPGGLAVPIAHVNPQIDLVDDRADRQ